LRSLPLHNFRLPRKVFGATWQRGCNHNGAPTVATWSVYPIFSHTFLIPVYTQSKNTITNYFSQLAQKRKREAPGTREELHIQFVHFSNLEHNSDDDFEEYAFPVHVSSLYSPHVSKDPKNQLKSQRRKKSHQRRN